MENKPKDSVVLIDEAYTHIAGAPFNTDLVAKDKDVVILRTFSKIYGMAGLRAGAALGRPDLLAKLGKFSGGMMPITGMAAATASLKVKDADSRAAQEDRHGSRRSPSLPRQAQLQVRAFCFELHHDRCRTEAHRRRDRSAQTQKVYVGRVWKSWPTKVRVTIGLQSEMDQFKAAFLKVMA